jgi:cytochrome P450
VSREGVARIQFVTWNSKTASAPRPSRETCSTWRRVSGGRRFTMKGRTSAPNERRLVGPPFHGERMHVYGPLMRTTASRVVDRWTPGARLRIHREMQSITLDVIVRAVFGVDQEAVFAPLRERVERFVAQANGPSAPVHRSSAVPGGPRPALAPGPFRPQPAGDPGHAPRRDRATPQGRHRRPDRHPLAARRRARRAGPAHAGRGALFRLRSLWSETRTAVRCSPSATTGSSGSSRTR